MAGAGGAGAGGAGGSAGSGTVAFTEFMIGADVSQIQQQEDSGTGWTDGGGEIDMFALLKARGFNWIRLRAFVDPRAQGGYSSQGYCDTANTAIMGARVKQAGLGFLLNLHYSDYWADPGKQIKPLAWRNISTIEALATQVHDYTKSMVETMIAEGARPDMVQIGNEITPGMLLHVPNNPSDPDGALTVTTPNGSIDNWPNLGMLLKAGVAAVHEVDPTIKIMLHTDRGGSAPASVSFVENATQQGVPFDVYGISCYVEYQGGPSTCENTMNAVLDAVPDANFQLVIAEYAVDTTNQQSITTTIRGTNDAVFNLRDNRGAGTFFWEPTRSGAWGEGLFTFSGGNGHAVDAYMDYYDQMKVDFVR
jgi:arabinogalactan endo-1,4-beta-galactosidase